MKSIIQEDRERCYLCGMGTYFEPLDEHHVFGGTANRKLSEKYGLKVYLHHSRCHIFNPKTAVHQNAKINNALKAKVQEIAMEHYGWTVEEFIKIFGKSYL